MRNAKSVELTDGYHLLNPRKTRSIHVWTSKNWFLKTSFVWNKVPLELVFHQLPMHLSSLSFWGVQKVYPQIELELYEQGSKSWIGVQEANWYWYHLYKPNPKEFESFYLTSDPLSVIVSKSSPLAKKRNSLKMLADEVSLYCIRASFNLHDRIIKACKHTGFNLISYLKQTNVISCYKQLVQTLPSHYYHLASALGWVKIQRLVPRSLYVPTCTRNHSYTLCYLEKGHYLSPLLACGWTS